MAVFSENTKPHWCKEERCLSTSVGAVRRQKRVLGTAHMRMSPLQAAVKCTNNEAAEGALERLQLEKAEQRHRQASRQAKCPSLPCHWCPSKPHVRQPLSHNATGSLGICTRTTPLSENDSLRYSGW